MKVSYHKRFLKQPAKIPSGARIPIEQFAFESLPRVSSVAELGKVEKMRGHDACYKARFGSYRVGMKLEGDALTLRIVMDRKDIYWIFP